MSRILLKKLIVAQLIEKFTTEFTQFIAKLKMHYVTDSISLKQYHLLLDCF